MEEGDRTAGARGIADVLKIAGKYLALLAGKQGRPIVSRSDRAMARSQGEIVAIAGSEATGDRYRQD